MALDAFDVDLESLILARNDAHPDGDWWFDPRSGECLYYGIDEDEDLPGLVEGVHVLVPRRPQPRDDIDAFIVDMADHGADDTLLEALARARRGKGGMRRFREQVAHTAAADDWSAFTIARESMRALDWLVARGLVDRTSADRRRQAIAPGF